MNYLDAAKVAVPVHSVLQECFQLGKAFPWVSSCITLNLPHDIVQTSQVAPRPAPFVDFFLLPDGSILPSVVPLVAKGRLCGYRIDVIR